MNVTTVATIVKAASAIVEYVRADQSAAFGLAKPVRIVVEGAGVGIGDYAGPGPLSFLSPSRDRVEFYVRPFPASAKLWNGPDVLPNNLRDGSLEGSLLHDLLWRFRHEIARATGLSPHEVQEWANGILVAVWRHYGRNTRRSRLLSRAAWHVTQWSRRWYHKVVKLLQLAAIATLLHGCAGCSAPPEWHVVEASEVIATQTEDSVTNAPSVR